MVSSISAMRASSFPCSSFAASYSAFADEIAEARAKGDARAFFGAEAVELFFEFFEPLFSHVNGLVVSHTARVR